MVKRPTLIDPSIKVHNHLPHELTVCFENITLAKLIKQGKVDANNVKARHCAVVNAKTVNNALEYDWTTDISKVNKKNMKNTFKITAISKDKSFNLTQTLQEYSFAGESSLNDKKATIHITISPPGFLSITINQPEKAQPFKN